MDFSKRQKQILDRLRPKPLHHGQLETELIAVPNLKAEDIAPERWQVLRDSFVQEGSNLIPLIVRRTEAYDDEEYEVIYGADWCLVAKELDIERLWVWVFDLDDEQAAVTKAEMELLLGDLGTPAPTPDVIKQMSSLLQRQESSLEKKISQQISEMIEQQLPKLMKQQLNELFADLENKVLNQLLSRSPTSQVQHKNYDEMNKSELLVFAKQMGLKKYSSLKKPDLIALIKSKI